MTKLSIALTELAEKGAVPSVFQAFRNSRASLRYIEWAFRNVFCFAQRHSEVARACSMLLGKVRGIDADIDVRVCGGSGGDRYCFRQRDAGWHARDLDRANRHRYAKSCRPQRSLRRPP